MRVLKNVLIGLGVIFLGFLALFTWVGMSSRHFRQEQTPFVETFVTDLSKRWNIEDVQDRLDNAFIEQAGTPQAQQLLHQFKLLGALKSVHDLDLQRYVTNTQGRTGVFYFKGTFENGEAAVNVTIVQKDGAVRVSGFYLQGTRVRDGGSRIHT
jgi:hypothetical protein